MFCLEHEIKKNNNCFLKKLFKVKHEFSHENYKNVYLNPSNSYSESGAPNSSLK